MLILTIMVLFSDSTKTDFHYSQLKKKTYLLYTGDCVAIQFIHCLAQVDFFYSLSSPSTLLLHTVCYSSLREKTASPL